MSANTPRVPHVSRTAAPLMVQGELQALLGPVAYGWAYLPQRPDDRVIVEILADGCPIGSAVADLFDPQIVRDENSDGCHAFAFPLPGYLFEHGCRLGARIANLGIALPGRLLANKAREKALPRRLLWQVSNHGDFRIVGWVWDPENAQVAQTVSFYEGSQRLGACIADQPSAELIEKGFGDGRYAFSYTLPASLQDGKIHRIRVLVADKELAQRSVSGAQASAAQVFDRLLQLPGVMGDASLAADVRALQAEHETRQNYRPSSFDFSSYEQWYAAYGAEYRPAPQLAVAPKFLIIIDGEEGLERTLDSLDQQPPAIWRALYQKGNAASRRGKNSRSVVPRKWVETLQTELTTHTGLVTWINAGDTLPPGALLHMAAAFARHPEIRCAYSDSDGPFSADGQRHPWCKPAWDPQLQFATGYVNHLFVCRAEPLAQQIPEIRQGQDIVWCALAMLTEPPQIHHLPEILYHHAQRPPPPDREAHAVLHALSKQLPGARLAARVGYNALLPAEPRHWPKVSLVIPTRDRVDLLKPCIESLLKTDYPDLEIIVADNDSSDPATLRYLQRLKGRCRVVRTPGSFNFPRINNLAVAEAQGDLIALVNNDIEAVDPAWLKRMVAHLDAPSIGAVGAKLLWPNGMVQHAGVVTGLNGLAGHIGNNWFKDDAGYFGLNQITHRVAAATAACLLLRKSDYGSVGGLDAIQFHVNFNDVDLCLKLRERGLEILWTPDAQLLHHESASRGMDSQSPQKMARTKRESQALLEKWGETLRHDPYYNPNLNLDRYSHTGLSVPPRKKESS